MSEVYVTELRVKDVHHFGELLRAAEMNLEPREWGVKDHMTLVLYGDAAKRVSDEGHRLGLPMRGYTEVVEVDD